jgi:hypothetical protein
MFIEALPEETVLDLLTRWFRIRKIRPDLVPVILQEWPKHWTFHNPLNPWGSRERLTDMDLRTMVERAEYEQLRHEGRSEKVKVA